ncbi:hypothetical protein Tco_1058774 [Tanacetum coccineum]|uniref:Reverse transcriptase domain-containing protein n=1 Tax=Tanacetum coccineum TaxID=301880 RepID=A0ABQ5HAY7_9ASTR
MPSLSEAEVKRLLSLPTPPPSPLISLSPPSVEERFARCLAAPALPSPLLPPLPSSLYLPPPVPTSLPAPSPPLPPLPTLLFIPPLVDRRKDIPEVELPPCKRLCLTTPTSRYEVRQSSTAAARPTGGHRADYGFIGTLDAETRRQRAKEIDSLIKESRRIDRGKSISPRECVADGVGGFSFSRGLGTGQLSVALGQIEALQARDPTHADDPEGVDTSMANNIPPKRTSATAARAAVVVAAPMTVAVVEQLIEARVSEALPNHETLQNSTNGHGDGSHNSGTGIRGTVRTTRECTYKDFLNCKPLTFKGTEGVVVLSQWFEKMESVFHINNCAVENQKALKKMMAVKYCPRGEIKKLEIELWNLKVKDEVEKYVGGLPDMIRGNVMSYQPKAIDVFQKL